jgi:hypothetical protein
MAPPSLHTIIDELDFAYWWPTEIGWRRASGAFKRGVTIDITTDAKESRSHTQPESEEIMINHPLQRKAYDAVGAALPFTIDPAKISVEPGVSYLPSPIKLHDYAAGVMAAFGSVVEYLGGLRGLPSQTMTLNRRVCGFHLNELQVQLLNGYAVVLDTWPIGADNGAYRTKDGRYVWMIGLFPHMVNALLGHLQCAPRRSRPRSRSTPRSSSRMTSLVAST